VQEWPGPCSCPPPCPHPQPPAPDTAFWLGETDVWLLAEGKHLRPWQKLGAHATTLDGQTGTAFAVWAPHARQVGLVGDFNEWRAQPMRLRPECGVWELFVPGAAVGDWYKFDVQGSDGHRPQTDPTPAKPSCPRRRPRGPALKAGQSTTAPTPAPAPMAIYEVHVARGGGPCPPGTT
jgi:1,4-alpha-glucan branching enzyme